MTIACKSSAKGRPGLWVLALLLLALALVPARAQQAASTSAPTILPDIVDARVLANPQRARLVLDLSAPTEFAIASLDKPDRIVVDVKASGLRGEPEGKPAGQGLISGFSVRMAAPGRGRAELVLTGPAQVQQAYVLDAFDDQPARLVVDLIPDSPEHFAKAVALDFAAAKARAEGNVVADTPTAPGASNVEAKGARPLIVIDPGHGGVDGGAEAADGVKEKTIVLAFAKALQKLLVAAGRFDVALTRQDDTFLKLEDRVSLARRNKADLFISIHADTFQDSSIRGASIYIRDERATDVLDKVLADSENKADLVAGFTPPEAPPRVVDVLVDLMRRQMRRQSYIAAEDMAASLGPSVRLRRYPVRRANFFVLQAPDVPSVLVELGFLSNPRDIENLTAGEWRDRTAEALARGISAYFDGQMQK